MAAEVFLLSKDQDEIAFIEDALKPQGCEVRTGSGVASALKTMRGSELVFLSLDGNSLDALKEIKSYHPEAVVLVADAPDSAGRALKEGAFDFLEKPFNPLRLGAAVRNALKLIKYRDEIHRLKNAESPRLVPPKNKKMLNVSRQVERASAKGGAVLILGEKGTGKEAVAKVIHYNSARMAGPLVVVEDPAAEGEAGLFGKAGAKGSARGRIMAASGGTLFLKNMDGLPSDLAKKLAAFIREKKFAPEGGAEAIRPDVRVVCSAASLDSKGPLGGCFQLKISIPPLRERPEDVVPLAERFLEEACRTLKTGQKKFSKGAKEFLVEHTWPGNAGELKNAVKKACLISRESLIERRHLASGDGDAYCSVGEFLDDKLRGYLKGMAKTGASGLFDAVTAEVERALIELALKETGGNQLKAAKLIGMNRNTFRAKIKLYKIKNGRSAKAPRAASATR